MMALKSVEFHHASVRAAATQEAVDVTARFYTEVMGFKVDDSRPFVKDAPGYWLDDPSGRAQVHVIGAEGVSAFAKRPDQDATKPHVAYGVEDIHEAMAELDGMGVRYWVLKGLTNPDFIQVYFDDPSGNMIEIHQVGTCMCQAVVRLG